jgi:outer membrane murein-binding lipoprotein Lpp
MKKVTLLFLSASLMGATLLTSCNKKLKEDIKDLDSQVSDLKSQNEALQNQANTISAAIGSNEPITATTTFVDDNGATRTWTDTYNFKAGNYSTQYMEANGDGTFDIYIERFSDVDWYEGAWLEFTYDPTSGAVTNKEGGHYWDWNLPYNDATRFYEGYTGCTITIAISSINTTTGAISLSFTGVADDTYGANSSTSYVPNDNKGATTTFSFTGTLKVYPNN